ncbi:MAG: hypothetical protein IKZ88_09665 [Neisseriaceae bacterium]|nr:hypothetical protein [Neisseriaceae bacterium]
MFCFALRQNGLCLDNASIVLSDCLKNKKQRRTKNCRHYEPLHSNGVVIS